MGNTARPFAIVTGASSGIGLELAKLCVGRNYHVLIAVGEPAVHRAAETPPAAGRAGRRRRG